VWHYPRVGYDVLGRDGGEFDEACTSTNNVKADPEKRLGRRGATGIGCYVAGATRTNSDREKSLSDTDGPSGLVNCKSSGHSTRRVSRRATDIPSERETRLVDNNSVQNMRIITDYLVKTVDTGVKGRDDNVSRKAPARPRGQQRTGIV
jgi:hypothetical protein